MRRPIASQGNGAPRADQGPERDFTMAERHLIVQWTSNRVG